MTCAQARVSKYKILTLTHGTRLGGHVDILFKNLKTLKKIKQKNYKVTC